MRLFVAAGTIALALMADGAHAQTYPSTRISFVVAFAPGGVADTVARIVAQGVEQRLGQSVVVENRAGAGGDIAAAAVANAAPDGYTVLVTTTALAINETLRKNKGFAASDLRTVAIAASSPEALIVNPDNPAKTLPELVAAAKIKPINFGTAGVGSGSHIAAEYFFKEVAKVNATHIPFQGGAPAMNAVMGNQIDLLATTLGGGAAAQVASGKLRGVAIASDKRVSVTPDAPTFGEGGYPGYVAESWVGWFIPAKTDAVVATKLNAAINATISDPAVQQRLATLGFRPINGSPEKAEAYFREEAAKWGKMVKALNLSVQ